MTDIAQQYYADLESERKKELYKIVNLENSGLSPEMSSALSTLNYAKSTGVRLNQRIQELLYFYTFSETNLVCSCFSAKMGGVFAIYGFLYSEWDTDAKKYVHKFICASPTYRSQDGEYRHRIIPYWQWEALQKRFEDVFEIAESYILDQLEKAKLEFNTIILYPKVFTGDEKTLEEDIDGKRLPVFIYMLSWLYDFHQIHIKIVENHINPAYQAIIYHKSGIPIYQEIVKKLELMNLPYDDFIRYTSELHQDVNRPIDRINIDVGQKIFTMTKNEFNHTGDINYPVWREFYFTRLCADLVINFVTPCFSIMNRFFYIQNSDEAIFDNPSQHERYVQAGTAKEINTLLTEVDRLNFVGRKRASTYINSKFFLLSRKINKTIKFSQGNIQLIDISVCLTNEHTGRTLRDLPALSAFGSGVSRYAKFFNNIGVFRKHIFEFLYTFYCANSKVGLIHGDLHLNNATIYESSLPQNDPPLKDPRVCYIVDNHGKPKTFSFEHQGLYSMVIDMSRGITRDRELLEHDFGKRFAEMYMKDQNQRVMRLILHHFPVAVERHKEKLEDLLQHNFDAVFRLLTLVDPFMITKNLEIMFGSEVQKFPDVKIDPLIPKFLKRIVSMTEILFLNKFSDLINGKITDINTFEWPCLTLINDLYSEDEVKDPLKLANSTIVDIFTMMNPLKYSIKRYETMNELVKLDLENRIRKKYNIDIKENIDAVNEFQKDESDKRSLLIHKYQQEPKELPLDSSWMFE